MAYPVCEECYKQLTRYAAIQPMILWGVAVLTGLIWGLINVITKHRLGFVIGFELGAGIGFVLGLISVEIFQNRVNSWFIKKNFWGTRTLFKNKSYNTRFEEHMKKPAATSSK